MKSLPEDRDVLANPDLAPLERDAALARLLADGVVDELRSIVEPLVWHSSELLRSAALNYFLHYLGADEYVAVALERLDGGKTDSDSQEAGQAAYALGQYVAHTGRQRLLIYQRLIEVLEESENPYVQHVCYEALLRAEGCRFPNVTLDFDRARDVDWKLIEDLRRIDRE
jgi:hypothetical protein